MNQPCLDSDSIALNRMVILSTIGKTEEDKTQGGLFIVDMQASENYRVVKGKVVSVGPKAAETGIAPGDVVLYDKHSAFATSFNKDGNRQSGELVITDMMNVIVKLNKE